MEQSASKEKRRERRITALLPIRFAVVDNALESAKWVDAKVVNISLSGLRFETAVPLAIHSRLEFQITIPGDLETLNLRGTLVRVASEKAQGEGIEYGAAFDVAVPDSALAKFVQSIDVYPLLEAAMKRGASDLHLSASVPPVVRVRGELMPLNRRTLKPETVEHLVLGILSPLQWETLRRDRDICFLLILPDIGRWRVNAYYQRGMLDAVFSAIDSYVPTLEELGMPPSVRDLAACPQGLILVTGPSGSGKTSTMAALVRYISDHYRRNILTVEDPIEFIHANQMSIVRQREVGSDTQSFGAALRHAMRQDFDVIALSDMTDPDAVSMALHAAEAGRLVLGVLPTLNTIETVNRITALYPRERRGSILHVLSVTLRGIICQKRLPAQNADGAATALEIITCNDGIRRAIRMNRLDQIAIQMATAPGTQSMEVSLRNLVMRGLVDIETAAQVANDPEHLRNMVAELRV